MDRPKNIDSYIFRADVLLGGYSIAVMVKRSQTLAQQANQKSCKNRKVKEVLTCR